MKANNGSFEKKINYYLIYGFLFSRKLWESDFRFPEAMNIQQ